MNLPAISGSRFSTRLLVFALSSIVLTSDLFAQRFQILDVSRNADGKVIIRFEANTNSYIFCIVPTRSRKSLLRSISG